MKKKKRKLIIIIVFFVCLWVWAYYVLSNYCGYDKCETPCWEDHCGAPCHYYACSFDMPDGISLILGYVWGLFK